MKIQIKTALTDAEALAYAQFLKRVTFGDYLGNAVDKEEAYLMVQAGERIREALAEEGCAPR